MSTRTRSNVSLSGRPTWAEIDLDALATNFHVVQKRVGETINIMAVVKANAYGHGAVRCATRLADEGAASFGVALPEEAIELRTAGIKQPICCLEGFWLGQEAAVIQHHLTPILFRVDQLEALNHVAK